MSDNEIAKTIHKLLTLLLDPEKKEKINDILKQINKIITESSNTSAIQEVKSAEDSQESDAKTKLELDAAPDAELNAGLDARPNAIGGGKKALTKYNIFMRSELERLKQKKPKADYKARFKEAVNNWKKSNKQ
jgi:vacuolar-type H+-ATPase subunit I/STV1